MAEGLKLAAALRDWAVDSGAMAAVADLTASAASSATAYLEHLSPSEAPAQDEPQAPVARCADCPVCRGLDALDRTNPDLAHTARAALAQVTGLLADLLPGDSSTD